MKDKPVKFGVKMWMAADSISAYCWNFDVYVGKRATQINQVFGLSAQVVIDLTKDLAGKGYTIFTDNFYTSPKLAHFLASKEIYTCGTVRTNRHGYPQELVKTKAEARQLPGGHFDWMQCGSLVATSWKDNKMVYFLSTAHMPELDQLATSRKNKDGTIQRLPSTPCVEEYGRYMGGVDRNDQMTRLNKSKKSMRWYRKIERKLLELSVYNAYIIEGTIRDQKVPGKRKRDMMSFKLDLAHALVGTSRLRKRSAGRSRSENSENILRLDNISHLPAIVEGKDHVCVVCNERHNRYKRKHPEATYSENPFKRCKTTIKCSKCDKYLCCNTKNMCFTDFHTLVNL
ncbi:piggyBac transposable element-derived protein 4-like [Dreissena polymorpha]|uniref:piggyBac transposable element-derived protein 4-like n=1 Tax=Dreissena polymorpha TaxID=45954 RepID=UPI002264394C|nr:piggyBac transposable element-derived protein 4-like [Dreissena polymorpha]